MRGASAALLSLLFAATPALADHVDGHGDGARGARWQDDAVRLVVDPSMDALVPDAVGVVVEAVNAWQMVADSLPTITVERGTVDGLGYDPDSPNINSIRFVPEGSARAKGALAITVVTFDQKRGEILDADILLNGEHRFAQFGVEEEEEHGSSKVYDVQNVMTHEIGHLLGLGENYDQHSATMYAFSLPGETSKRDLDVPDEEDVLSLYGGKLQREPGKRAVDEPDVVGCGGGANISGQRPHGGFWSAALGVLAAASLLRRTRRGFSSLPDPRP